jgi:hypothetical protein
MSVLYVECRVLSLLFLRKFEIEIDRVIRIRLGEELSHSVHSDLIHDFVKHDDRPAALRHTHRFSVTI